MTDQDQSGFQLEDGAFIALVLLVTLAFAWLAMPFFGAILWGVVAAILFGPLNRALTHRLGGRKNLASALTLLLILTLVIAPAIMLGFALVQEASVLFQQFETGEIDFATLFVRLHSSLPQWARDLLGRSGVTDFEAARDMLASGIANGLEGIAARVLTLGQGAFRFLASLGVMLYLTFFLLRDGDTLGRRIVRTIPLRPSQREELMRHFVVVIRATIKGSIVIAILQGIIGGIIFSFLGIEGALLWGVLMGVFSLVPAVGTGIIWVPVAIYLLVTGAVWQGLVLTFMGVFVIGMVDNLLRPILVGHDTRMPDFVVLISTLAGLELLGLNGFIIGPIIAALFIAVWQLVEQSRSNATTIT